MKSFKMICFSAKCTGVRITANGSVKFEDKFVRDCPDCGHALFRDVGGNGKIKDKVTVSRPTAEFGFKSRRRYDQDV